MNPHERMLDLIEREIRVTNDEWTDADIIIRIREIEASDADLAAQDGTDAPESLSDDDCQRIVNALLHPDWGGYRAGAGRPAVYQTPMLDKTVRLPVEAIDEIAALGGGNLSAGVRELWRRWRS